MENNLDEQKRRLYMEGMEKATISDVLAYLIAAGLGSVSKSPTYVIHKMVLDRASTCLLSFLIFAQNQRNETGCTHLSTRWTQRVPCSWRLNLTLTLKRFLCGSTNVSGMMHLLDETPAINREATELPGFLFPSQIASLVGRNRRPVPSICSNRLTNILCCYITEIPNATFEGWR